MVSVAPLSVEMFSALVAAACPASSVAADSAAVIPDSVANPSVTALTFSRMSPRSACISISYSSIAASVIAEDISAACSGVIPLPVLPPATPKFPRADGITSFLSFFSNVTIKYVFCI